jgi:ESCRT-I complex subunit TSG101
LLSLTGTIPVAIRGNTYNIPVSIWLPHQYPHVPPIAFVTPTNQMVIKPNQHVDLAGKIYHPYLSYWASRKDVRFVGTVVLIWA